MSTMENQQHKQHPLNTGFIAANTADDVLSVLFAVELDRRWAEKVVY